MRVCFVVLVGFIAILITIIASHSLSNELNKKRLEKGICSYSRGSETIEYKCSDKKALIEILKRQKE